MLVPNLVSFVLVADRAVYALSDLDKVYGPCDRVFLPHSSKSRATISEAFNVGENTGGGALSGFTDPLSSSGSASPGASQSFSPTKRRTFISASSSLSDAVLKVQQPFGNTASSNVDDFDSRRRTKGSSVQGSIFPTSDSFGIGGSCSDRTGDHGKDIRTGSNGGHPPADSALSCAPETIMTNPEYCQILISILLKASNVPGDRVVFWSAGMGREPAKVAASRYQSATLEMARDQGLAVVRGDLRKKYTDILATFENKSSEDDTKWNRFLAMLSTSWAQRATEPRTKLFVPKGNVPSELSFFILYEYPELTKRDIQIDQIEVDATGHHSVPVPFVWPPVAVAAVPVATTATFLEEALKDGSKNELDTAVRRYEETMFPRALRLQKMTEQHQEAFFSGRSLASAIPIMIKNTVSDHESA